MIQQVNSDMVDGPPIPMSSIRRTLLLARCSKFILMGCGTVPVCTAAMPYGYRIVEDMIDGLSTWMEEKGFNNHRGFPRARASRKVTEWKHLNLELQDRRSDRSSPSASAASFAISRAGMARISASIWTG